MSHRLHSVPLIMAVCFSTGLADETTGPEEEQAVAILERYCAACHGDDFYKPGLDIRDRTSLITPEDGEAPYLTPGKPEDSRLLRVMREHTPLQMPPEDQPQPTKGELKLIEEWISAGAQFPATKRPAREPVTESDVVRIIADDVSRQAAEERPFLRYFTLTHLWSNPEVTDLELRLTRAGVSKLINSLSSQADIVPPSPIDEDSLILRIDLRDYGWTAINQWATLIRGYPYAIKIPGPDAGRLYELTQTQLTRVPFVRADWFVHNASRPQLYHQLVTLPQTTGIPDNVRILERLLNVDIQENFKRGQLVRAGFSGKRSGVSDNNRIVERHKALFGYFWASYDSAGNQGRQNFSRFPLGPETPESPSIAAFQHDGGEFIFSLPNGLQAYMLATADGKRIDAGPQTIVKDPNRFSGSFDILNGISCIGCHKHGMIRFEDTIRPLYENSAGEKGEKVRQLYPTPQDMQPIVDADRERFLWALRECIGPFVEVDSESRETIEQFPEPVTFVAKRYRQDLNLGDAARELGLDGPDAPDLKVLIRNNRFLQRLELLPLTIGETITRPQWERVFGTTCNELGIGIPVVPL